MTDYTAGDLIYHPTFGTGVITKAGSGFYTVDFTEAGTREMSKSEPELRKLGRNGDVDLGDVLAVFRMLMRQEQAIDVDAEISERWQGGKLVMVPGKLETQSKEIPIEIFMHKIVMVREKLRVLEQKINNNPKLDDTDRVELQQYITRCYGTLTTFNALFRHREQWFRGDSGK